MKSLNNKIKLLRVDTGTSPLDEKSFSKSPFVQFEKWMNDAIKYGIAEPNAMTLATSDKNGWPDARVVLLRDYSSKGFSFFTNYFSIKGQEIRHNKKVCLNFYWSGPVRQIRIKGVVQKVSERASNDYFYTRPRESQISAWASCQSEKLSGLNELMERYRVYEMKYEGKKVERPPHWGGYILSPVYFEFWQGQVNRLHNRIIYEKSKQGKWIMGRLNP